MDRSRAAMNDPRAVTAKTAVACGRNPVTVPERRRRATTAVGLEGFTPGSAPGRGREAFDDHGVGQAARFADDLEPEAAVALLQRIQQRGGQPGPGGAERMAEGDGAAVDVDLVEVGADLL